MEEIHEEHIDHMTINVGLITMLVLLMLYMAFGVFKKKSGFSFGHQAPFVCLLGFCISLLFLKYDMGEFEDFFRFRNDIFFYIVLPPVIFAAGFNMQRKSVFKHIGSIFMLGLFGTIISFILFCVMTFYWNEDLKVTQFNWETGKQSEIYLTHLEILLVCCVLSSTDSRVALSQIKSSQNPKMYSVIFGSGIMNDVVAIVLF